MFELELDSGVVRLNSAEPCDVRWLLGGKRHRENNFHRENGPAVEAFNGSKFWYFNGNSHREDGPASEYANGRNYWYLNGNEVTEEEVMKCSS